MQIGIAGLGRMGASMARRPGRGGAQVFAFDRYRWLLDLCAEILREDEALVNIAPAVADSGEDRRTMPESVALGVPAPVTVAQPETRPAAMVASIAVRILAAGPESVLMHPSPLLLVHATKSEE